MAAISNALLLMAFMIILLASIGDAQAQISEAINRERFGMEREEAKRERRERDLEGRETKGRESDKGQKLCKT